MTLVCPECGNDMVLRQSKYGQFYGCTGWPRCDVKHSAHQKTGEPMGIPANKETRQARIKAHNAFDELWKCGNWRKRNRKRKEAYVWMGKAMGLGTDANHIGRFTKEPCEKLIKLVEEAQSEA